MFKRSKKTYRILREKFFVENPTKCVVFVYIMYQVFDCSFAHNGLKQLLFCCLYYMKKKR